MAKVSLKYEKFANSITVLQYITVICDPRMYSDKSLCRNAIGSSKNWLKITIINIKIYIQ